MNISSNSEKRVSLPIECGCEFTGRTADDDDTTKAGEEGKG